VALESAADGRPATIVLLVVLIYCATVTGHQLTPFPALLTVTGLVLFAGLETRLLPIIMAVILASWIGYMTTDYLGGHFNTVAGTVGSVGQNLDQNVSGRLGGSGDHQLIVHDRIVASAAIWILAVLGLARRLRAGRADVALAVVGSAPFLLVALQPYGGEILLRVFLFSLPAVAFFISCLAFPAPTAGRSWRAAALFAVVGCALLWAFQYTRYGNERLDYFTRGDVAAVRALYRIAPKGSELFAGTPNLPWRYRDYAGYDYELINELPAWRRSPRPDPHVLARELDSKLQKRGGYVIVTRSTKIGAGLLEGKPGALEGLVGVLRVSPNATQVYRGRDGDVFFIRPAARGTRT
jgi:hypothetical protein